MDTDNVDRQELIDVEEIGPEIAKLMRQFGAHEPDWVPLEKVMPRAWCAGFMFMGYDGDIRMYKHGFTRNYILVDPAGHTYMYLAEEEPARYVKIPRRMAIEGVFSGLEGTGAKRHTPFDDRARAERRRALADAGWTMLSVSPDGVEKTEPSKP